MFIGQPGGPAGGISKRASKAGLLSLDSPLVRQWILLRTLAARQLGATVRELATELEVSEKTIRRDLEMLASVGFPFESETGEFGRKRWRMAKSWQPGDVRLAFDEALALYLGRRQLEPLAGTLIWDAAQRAYQKIQATLSKPVLRYVEKIGAMFFQTSVGANDYARHAEIIDQLLVGIEDRRVVFLTYQSARATEPVTYDMHPYGLTYHRGALYLVGYAPQHQELRHWKVNRIEAASVDSMFFQRPADFDMAKHFGRSFGVFHGTGDVRVKVRFSAAVARYVRESKWHESQDLSPQSDGSLLAEFRLSSVEELKRWLYTFGPQAEVLEPQELRREMATELQQTLQLYEAPRAAELANPKSRVGQGNHGKPRAK